MLSAPRHSSSPLARRVALPLARLACITSLLMFFGFTVAGLAHFFTDVGNYPEARHRHAVGALFLFLFAPVTLGLHLLARRRVSALRAFASKPPPDGRV